MRYLVFTLSLCYCLGHTMDYCPWGTVSSKTCIGPAYFIPILERNYLNKTFYKTYPLNQPVKILSLTPEPEGGEPPLFWYSLMTDNLQDSIKCILQLDKDSALWCPDLSPIPFSDENPMRWDAPNGQKGLELWLEAIVTFKAEEVGRKLEVAKQKELKKSMYKKFGPKWASKILKGKIAIGMDREMVIASWGDPESKNRTVGSWGVHEQWVYGSTYLYFEDGILKSFQDSGE